MAGRLCFIFYTRKFLNFYPVYEAKIMSEGKRELERLREMQRRSDEEDKREARRLRDMIQRLKDSESPQTSRKRTWRRELGGTLPNGALSPLQIETIKHYRSLPLSYGEISFLMAISKSSAHKYGKDVQSDW